MSNIEPVTTIVDEDTTTEETEELASLKTHEHLSKDRLTKTIITYGLRKLGDQAPYFTITGDVWIRRSTRSRFPVEPETCGAIHDHILDVLPQFEPLVHLHLADEHGVPMYAVANGWYFFDMADDDPHVPSPMRDMSKTERAGSYLRVDPARLDKITTKEEFERFVDSLKDEYEREAQTAIEVFGLTVPNTPNTSSTI